MTDTLSIQHSENQERLKKIRLLALDVDGVLTDGKMTYIDGSGWIRFFCTKDGLGIRRLMKAGIDVAFITAGQSKCVKKRAELLRVKHCYTGTENKLDALNSLMNKLDLTYEQVAFIGDDFIDIPALEKVGLAVTVPGAFQQVKDKVHCITSRCGGDGAAREVAEEILKFQGE